MDVAIWLVTGRRGAGKTTFCTGVARAARLAGWDTAGILSPAEFQGTSKVAIWAEDARSGEKRRLASFRRQAESDLAFGNWFFDLRTLAWGNQVLQTCLPCDLLVVDELGPLEFRRGEGWQAAFEAIERGRYKLGLVVIRPDLLEIARERFQPGQIIDVEENPTDPQRIFGDFASKRG